MPPIRSVVCAPDRVTIETSKFGTVTLTRAMIPAATLNVGIAATEAWINTRLASLVGLGFQAQVHVTAVFPQLLFTMICANVGSVIPANWWSKA